MWLERLGGWWGPITTNRKFHMVCRYHLEEVSTSPQGVPDLINATNRELHTQCWTCLPSVDPYIAQLHSGLFPSSREAVGKNSWQSRHSQAGSLELHVTPAMLRAAAPRREWAIEHRALLHG